MSATHTTPQAPPLLGLLAELRAQAQLRAEQAGPLAASHALVLAWLTLLLALLGRGTQPLPEPVAQSIAPWERPGVHGLLPTGEQPALARILYVIGPRPCRGMRPLPAARPAPELRPPIPRRHAHPPRRPARSPARGAAARARPLESPLAPAPQPI